MPSAMEMNGGQPTYRSILRLVWPLALGMVNNAVMQFVDRAYLANDSLRALEAVLPAGMLMWIFAGFFQSVVGYSSVFVGQYHGAGDVAKCRTTCRVALVLAAVFGILSVPLVPLGNFLLSLTSASGALLEDERTYYSIMLAGAVFVYGQMAAASYFTGRGQTRLVFWIGLAGNLVNAALDPLLIFGWGGLPRLGIAGAAYATVAAMAVQTAVLCLLAHRDLCRAPASRTGEAREIAGRILRFGLPSGAFTTLNLLSFTIFVFVTGGIGDLELAVSNACFTVNYLLFAPMEGFALGASTLVAQAIGRGDPGAAALAARRTILLGVGFVAVLALLVLAFMRPILDLFASGAGEAAAKFHALGRTLFLVMFAWLLFDAASAILSGALKGTGDTKFVMGWLLVGSFFIWLPLVFAVRRFHNTMPALWGTLVVDVCVLFFGTWVRWRRGKWKEIRLV